MNRAERRRIERESGKKTQAAIQTAQKAKDSIASKSAVDAAKLANVRVELIMDYLHAREEEIMEDARKMLYKAEDYISVANVMTTLYAINKTWGYTKSIRRFLDNYNDAMNLVDEMGVREAYEKAHQEWGIEIEFDDMDINKEFGFTDGDDAP